MKTKTLYNFKVGKEVDVEKTHLSTDENGQEIKTIKKVKEKVDYEYAIKKPNRVLFDEAELFYGIKISEAIKSGVLTKASVIKRYDNDGGVFSDKEQERIKNYLTELAELQAKYKTLEEKKNKSEAETVEESNVISKINQIRTELVEMESQKASLFEQTAENRARNKTIMWWVLNLAHRKQGDKYVPFFEGETFEEKIKKYDEIEESDNEFLKKILVRFAYLITFWYVGKITDEKDFKEVDLVEVEQIDTLNQKLEDLDKDENKESELPPKSE